MLGAASTGAERPFCREHRSAAATTQTGPAVGFVRHSKALPRLCTLYALGWFTVAACFQSHGASSPWIARSRSVT